jgi:exodeoxyribonuclease VII small subunit
MSKASPKKSADDFSDFESALAELEKILKRMERGEQPLEEALKDFERGVALTHSCRKRLQDAEQRVEKLVTRDGVHTSEPFEPESE